MHYIELRLDRLILPQQPSGSGMKMIQALLFVRIFVSGGILRKITNGLQEICTTRRSVFCPAVIRVLESTSSKLFCEVMYKFSVVLSRSRFSFTFSRIYCKCLTYFNLVCDKKCTLLEWLQSSTPVTGTCPTELDYCCHDSDRVLVCTVWHYTFQVPSISCTRSASWCSKAFLLALWFKHFTQQSSLSFFSVEALISLF